MKSPCELIRRRHLIATLALSAAVLAQTGPPAVSLSRMQADLQYLCSGKLEGRLSLSPGADLAARYIAASFEKAQLAPASDVGFLQPFPLLAAPPPSKTTPANRPAPASASLTIIHSGNRKQLRSGVDYRATAWRNLSLTGAVVFVGYGITAPEYGYDDYAGIDVAGKIVLAFDHEPQETDPHSIFNGTGQTRHASSSRVKPENARRHGAVAMLIVSEPLRKHPSAFDPALAPSPKSSLRATAPRQTLDDELIPVFTLSDPVAAELLRASGHTPAELQSSLDRNLRPVSTLLPGVTVELATTPDDVRHGQSANVIGWLQGSDPALRSETIMITAHYDHLGVQNGRLYPGANDNASGTVAVMELARLFAQGAVRPRRSLLFVVFGSEEEGLLGSYFYVAHPVRPLATTRGVLNLDMIARDEAQIPQSQGILEIPSDTRNEINLVAAFYSPDLESVIRKANQNVGLDISTKFDRDHQLNALFRCDHLPFLLHDVPAVWLFGGFHPGYHEPSDTVDQLNYPKLEKVVRLAYLTARTLADTSSPPRFHVQGNHSTVAPR